MKCAVDDCARAAEKRGWCGGHYYRWQKHGSPTGGRVRNGEARKFLENFVDPQTDECVLWPYTGHGNGYGSKIEPIGYPHQFICEKFHGPAPTPEHEVAHRCGTRLCINPRHVKWSTKIENEHDKRQHDTVGQKLSRADVLRIKAMKGRNGSALASEFGVTRTTISHILTGRTWAWLS